MEIIKLRQRGHNTTENWLKEWRKERRRAKCRKDFQKLPEGMQMAIRALGGDPESLIDRGVI